MSADIASNGARQRMLAGRRALVTGSSGGLGYAIAEGLAQAGCSMVLHGLDLPDQVAVQQQALRLRHGIDVAYIRSDLSQAGGALELMRRARAELGPVDILVNNAVVRHFAPIDEFPPEAWDRALAVNVSAAFHLVRETLPDMRARRWGRIVNLTSVYGERGTVNRVDYVTTKSALIGFTRAVAMETLNDGITCNAVSPGSVLTPGTQARVEQIRKEQDLPSADAERRFLAGKQPSGRFVRPDDVAAAVTFLCSDAARDITGIVLPVDGGWLAS